MSSKKPVEQHSDLIERDGNFQVQSFDLDRLDNFVQNLGVEYSHYKSMPSPIGQGDRGDYRRNDGVDTITSNGMLYFKSGHFVATMTDNSRDRKRGEAGTLDGSESRLVLPRFYNDGERIYLSPGDRIYVADKEADVLVSNTQKMDYELGVDNIPMFPIVKFELPIIDNRNIQYTQGVDFCTTNDGNIRWLPEGKNPGIDPNTGKGRIYSIRYLYKSYWYITTLIKEVRVTNVTTDGERKPERMPYHAVVVREFLFHNQNKGNKENQLKSKDPQRAVKAPTESIISGPVISVDMTNFQEE